MGESKDVITCSTAVMALCSDINKWHSRAVFPHMKMNRCRCEIIVINRYVDRSICETIEDTAVTLITKRKSPNSGYLIINSVVVWNWYIDIHGTVCV